MYAAALKKEKQIVKFDSEIYLEEDLSLLIARISIRNREGENYISYKYLQRLQTLYKRTYKNEP